MPIRKLKSGSYQIDFKLRGMPRYRRVHPEAKSKRDAQTIESKLLQMAFDRRWRPRYGEELFEDFAKNTYMAMARSEKRSHHYDEIFINQAIPYFKGMRLIDITPEDVRNFRDGRAQDETRPGKLRAKGTLKREMAMLQRIFSYAIELEKLQVNPCAKVKTPYADNTRTRVISEDEERAVLKVLEREAPQIVPIVRLAVETGMRRGEILKLKPQYLDMEIKRDLSGNVISWGAVNLPGEICKSGKSRRVPLTESAHLILKGLIGGVEPFRLIFRIAPGYVSHLFTGACRRAGVEDASFHTLRHTFGTRLAQAGVHPAVIKGILGHASLQMTDRYVHPDEEMKHRAVKALSEHRSAEVVELKSVKK